MTEADENTDLLAAAAPDMLAALQEAAIELEYLSEAFREHWSGNAVLAKVRAAISKATATTIRDGNVS